MKRCDLMWNIREDMELAVSAAAADWAKRGDSTAAAVIARASADIARRSIEIFRRHYSIQNKRPPRVTK